MKQTYSERGAALLEFSIVLPLLILLVMGLIEFGLLFYNKQVLTNASREGARAGIAHLSETDIHNVVVNYCDNRLIRFDTNIDPTVIVIGALGDYPANLTVTVRYNYTFLVPELLGFGQNMQLEATTEMRMESALGS